MLRPLVAVLLALSIHGTCFGWGADGHKIIGAIAAASLSKETAKAISDLIGEETLADACCWADEIKSDKSYDWAKSLHYINAPRGAQSIDMKRDGAGGEQIVTAIATNLATLKDASQPKAKRVEALKFLLHFVGDIHQPLHVSYKEDLGGNKLTVQSFGKKSNLHKVFDTDLIQRRLRDTKGGWAVMSADLRQAITDEQRKQWLANLDALAWANESLVITIQLYKQPPADLKVDTAYYKQWSPVVNERLQMAGVRLGALLNDAFQTNAPAKKPA